MAVVYDERVAVLVFTDQEHWRAWHELYELHAPNVPAVTVADADREVDFGFLAYSFIAFSRIRYLLLAFLPILAWAFDEPAFTPKVFP